eukprot:IDg4144t1
MRAAKQIRIANGRQILLWHDEFLLLVKDPTVLARKCMQGEERYEWGLPGRRKDSSKPRLFGTYILYSANKCDRVLCSKRSNCGGGSSRSSCRGQRKLRLVLDGQTLHYALEPELQKKLVLVCRLARTVIACRVSPKQKTELVELVGQHLGMWAFGVVVFSVIVIDVHIMLLVYQSAWTKFTMSAFVLSLISWFLVGPVFSSKLVSLDAEMSPPMYYVVNRIFAEPRFWFVLLASPVICISPSLLWKYSKRRRRPNMKMLVQELIKSGKTREEITGELPKPLRRVPSYDPSAPGTPSGPVRFVRNGELEYMFSGFNFDNDESEVVLRRGFELARGARRRRMRFLKRAGSDTELDVEGVKSAMRESPRVRRRARSRGALDDDPPDIIIYDDEDESPPRRRRPPRYPADLEETPPVAPHPPRIDRSGARGAASTSAHRRAMSDGAVLAENQFERLERLNRHSGEFGSEDSE